MENNSLKLAIENEQFEEAEIILAIYIISRIY